MHCELLLAATLVILAQQVPAEPPSPADATAAEKLAMEYARAKLQLAEANLKRVEEMNRRVARTVPASVVAEFQSDVEEANVQVRQTASQGGQFGVWLRRAQSELQAATTRWKAALAGNRRVEGTFGELDVERFRLRAEVARLQLERGRSLLGASREAQLEWQVELLNNEVDRLNEEPSRISPSGRYYPMYWYWN
jgi:hypothetical protein